MCAFKASLVRFTSIELSRRDGLALWAKVMYQSNRSFYIHPGKPPGHLNFWKIFVQIPPSPGRKAVQMPPPSGKLPNYCFNFSDTLVYQSNRSFNIPPPGHTPGIWRLFLSGRAGIWSPLVGGGEFDHWPRYHVTSRADFPEAVDTNFDEFNSNK